MIPVDSFLSTSVLYFILLSLISLHILPVKSQGLREGEKKNQRSLPFLFSTSPYFPPSISFLCYFILCYFLLSFLFLSISFFSISFFSISFFLLLITFLNINRYFFFSALSIQKKKPGALNIPCSGDRHTRGCTRLASLPLLSKMFQTTPTGGKTQLSQDEPGCESSEWCLLVFWRIRIGLRWNCIDSSRYRGGVGRLIRTACACACVLLWARLPARHRGRKGGKTRRLCLGKILVQ